MKKWIKNALREWIPFEGAFQGFMATENTLFSERVIVESKGPSREIDISKNHCLLSLNPIYFGIWDPKFLEQNSWQPKDRLTLRFQHLKKKEAVNELELYKTHAEAVLVIEKISALGDGSLLICTIKNTELRFVHSLKILLAHRYLQLRNRSLAMDLSRYRRLCLAYTYPRQVLLFQLDHHSYSNVFPIDLFGFVENANRFIVCLSKKHAAAKILSNAGIFHIYSLGDVIVELTSNQANEAKSPKSQIEIAQLSREFHHRMSDDGTFFTNMGKRFQVTHSVDVGSHQMFIAKQEFVKMKDRADFTRIFYHVHYHYFNIHQSLNQG